KILLADDSVLMLDKLQEMLSNYPQVEIVASLKNGNAILEAITQFKPDLAVIDLRMPGLNGLEVLKTVRKNDRNIAIIILTFFATDNYRLACMLSGADYFFSKVYDFEKVEQVVMSLLQEEELNQKLRVKEMTAIRTGFHKINNNSDKQMQSKSQ
ncbi:MAG: response regulator transcription factor, partial [Bacteroidales bacterium]